MIVDDAREGGANAKYTKDITWYITINTNPDGYVKSHNENRMWRKTTNTNTPGPCSGVDPNRNFDANWSGPGASSNPCSDTYYGPSAFSEKESQAMADFLQGLNPKAGFQKSVSDWPRVNNHFENPHLSPKHMLIFIHILNTGCFHMHIKENNVLTTTN